MDGTMGGPYATPSQLTIPIFTKWMLVFEEPEMPVLWLAKATPRTWLEQGKKIAVTSAPTRFGNVSYELRSDIEHGKISAIINLPAEYAATTKLRLRAPGGRKVRAVTLNGASWTDFDAAQEFVTIPSGQKGPIKVEVAF